MIVYATNEQRVSGGGSLNLVNFVAEELGLEPGDISGTWDVSHQLQLIWQHVLKDNPKILRTIRVFFDAMSSLNLGKQSTIFHAKAQELGNLVLTNKNYQETRFVRSLIRGLRSATQNLPTIVHLLQEEYDMAALEKQQNTTAKEIGSKLKKLKDPRSLLLVT